MRKLIVLAILLLFSMGAIFALTGLVTWTWFENDPEVEYFRYQVDGEDDSEWTVVDWSVNEVTILLDISVLHELHLQQSYDGENWSESSIVESEVFTDDDFKEPEEDLFFEDELSEETAAEETVDFTEEEVPLETAQNEQPEPELAEFPEEPKYLPVKALDYGFGYLNSLPDSAGPKSLGVFVAYSRTFVKAREYFDIGFKANAAMYTSKQLFTDASATRLTSYVNALALVTTMVGNSDIYLGFGPDLGFNLINDKAFRVGISLELGIRYHRSEKISFGLAFADHHYLFPTDKVANRFDMRVFMSSAF